MPTPASRWGRSIGSQNCSSNAAQLADANFEGEDLYYWVKGGYGAALHDVRLHRESIAVSKLVREWTLSLRQPLGSMTIARSYLALGEAEHAYPHIQDVQRLTGDEVFDLFDRQHVADIRKALAAKA